MIGGIQDQRAAQTTAAPPPTEEAGTSGAPPMADSELDRDYWYPEHMPPGLELRDHHTWSDEHGNEHRVYTDQHGRKWDWSGEKEAQGDNSLWYTDADGHWHQVSAYDGVWMDTSWDENGEVRSGELETTPEEPKGQRPVLDPNDMWSGPLLPEEGAVPNPEGGDGGEPQPGTQTPEPPAQPPPGDGEGAIPGLGVPYRDFIPTFPMVKDPTSGQWRNAEPGEIPQPPVEQPPSAEQPAQPAPPPAEQQPPVAEQQPAPAPPPPHDGPANGGEGSPDGELGDDADGIPGEYGDGPDLDGNGIPDEIGINPDGLQPGYPNLSTSGDGGGGEEGAAALDPTGGAHAGATYGSSDWGGVEVPAPTVVPPSDAATGAEAMPGEYGGGGSALGGGWAPEEAAIDPYALQQPAYADPSTSGDGAWDPYAAGSSFESYTPPEEASLEEVAPVAEGEDPSALGSF